MGALNQESGVPLHYLAIISQAGAAAPTLDSPGVRVNTIGPEPLFSRNAAGVYDVIFPAPVIPATTIVYLCNAGQFAYDFGWTLLSATTVRLLTSNQTGNLLDSLMVSCTLDIMVFR